MAKTVEIILGYVETPVGATTTAAYLTDQYNSDKSGFVLVNQSAQTGAAVAGVTSIVKLTAGFTPFLSIKTNTLAATIVFLKITAEYRTNQTFEIGDVVSLVGNVAGVVGGIALLAGAEPAAILFSGIGIAANVYGIAYSDVGQKLFRTLIEPVFQKYFATNPSAAYPEYWLAPDLVLESLDRIKAAYGGRIAVTRWSPDTHEFILDGDRLDLYDSAGSSGSGQSSWSSIPQIFPVPGSPGWRIDIGPIEISGHGSSRGGVDRYH